MAESHLSRMPRIEQFTVPVKLPQSLDHRTIRKIPAWSQAIALIEKELRRRKVTRGFVPLDSRPAGIEFAFNRRHNGVTYRCLAQWCIWPWNYISDEKHPAFIGRVDVAWKV